MGIKRDRQVRTGELTDGQAIMDMHANRSTDKSMKRRLGRRQMDRRRVGRLADRQMAGTDIIKESMRMKKVRERKSQRQRERARVREV